jgi:prepilin-type N-terminal cleavage/methylation domain-containing protein
MKKILSDKKGFTLVEMLVVTLVTGIVLTACYQFFFSAWTLNTAIEDSTECQSMLDDAMYRLRTELADATSVVTFDRPDDFNEATYSFDEGYVYIISNKYSGYTIYSKDSTGVLQKTPVGVLESDEVAQLGMLELAAASGNSDDVAAYNSELKKVGTRTVIKFTVADSGNTKVVVEARNGVDAVDSLSSDVILRSAVSAGTGDSLKFKTGV